MLEGLVFASIIVPLIASVFTSASSIFIYLLSVVRFIRLMRIQLSEGEFFGRLNCYKMRARMLILIEVVGLLFLAPFATLSADECPFLYGIHDHEPSPAEYLSHIENASGVGRGWVTATVAVGHDPGDMGGVDFTWFSNRGHTVICRINNGYFNEGTIPLPVHYSDFATRCANFVANSPGCEIWVIANETNLACEWPPSGNHKAYVSPQSYADCFRLCYDAIKAVRPTHKVCSQALAPWAGPYGSGTLSSYTHDGNPLNWVQYMNQMLTAIHSSGGIDGIALHITSRGYNYSDIHSTAQMNAAGQLLYSSFYVYKDWVNYGIPSLLYSLPLYATECNGMYYWKGGHPENPAAHYESGWVQEIYHEIDNYNRTVAATEGKPRYHCINFYRWCSHCDDWNIDGDSNPYKSQILADLDDALTHAYRWDTSEPTPTPTPPAPTPTPLPGSTWCDFFEGTAVDTSPPEPDWKLYSQGGFSITQSGGFLRLVGSSGASYGGIYNGDYETYSDFAIHTKLIIVDTDSTQGGSSEANAEIRFRTQSGAGYSLSFKAGDADQKVNLRRSDTWAIIQNKQVSHTFSNGETFYVSIDCNGTQIATKVGTTGGADDVVNWELTDSTFQTGCFWLFGYQLKEADFDYVYVGPQGWNPFAEPLRATNLQLY